VLRRRRREGEDSPGLNEHGEPDLARPARPPDDERGQAGPIGPTGQSGQAGESEPAGLIGLSGGPWDISDNYPPAERIDFGSLLIPVYEGFDVQINVAEEEGAWVAVVREDSGMQLQAFAAPRSGGLWDEVRHEIGENIASSGGSWQEGYGPFGPELLAQVPIGDEDQQPAGQLQAVRFLGFNGPRWFLRGVISGPAAADPVLAEPFNALFADVVVVRGDYPAPPRDQLEIRLPDDVRRAIDEQIAQQEEHPDWYLPDPFARGPEITETR
jgi:hypothetical protein